MSEPVTQRIAAALRGQISGGELAPGALLPSEPELAAEWQVSRQTARTALQILEHEGTIAVLPRRGRIVRSYQRLRWRLSEFELPDHTDIGTADAWEADIERQGHTPTGTDLNVYTITPPAAIAEKLGLDQRNDLCVVRKRVRYIEGEPAITNDDYFDERLVRGTELAADEDTTREDILSEGGYEQVYDIDEITTRMPTQEETERLNLRTGTPVAEHVRTGYTAQDRSVRVSVSIVPGEKLILQYIVPT